MATTEADISDLDEAFYNIRVAIFGTPGYLHRARAEGQAAALIAEVRALRVAEQALTDLQQRIRDLCHTTEQSVPCRCENVMHFSDSAVRCLDLWDVIGGASTTTQETKNG